MALPIDDSTVADIFSDHRTYAVPQANAFLPAAARYLPFYLYFVFALYEGKNEIQKKMKYRCERSHLGYRVSPVRSGRTDY
jgi:hypothetical protein